jgi:hypothetical protein
VNDRVIASAKFAELYSVAPERAAAGEKIGASLAGIHEEDRERVSQEIQRSIETRHDLASEYRLKQSDSSIVWVEVEFILMTRVVPFGFRASRWTSPSEKPQKPRSQKVRRNSVPLLKPCPITSGHRCPTGISIGSMIAYWNTVA